MCCFNKRVQLTRNQTVYGHIMKFHYRIIASIYGSVNFITMHRVHDRVPYAATTSLWNRFMCDTVAPSACTPISTRRPLYCVYAPNLPKRINSEYSTHTRTSLMRIMRARCAYSPAMHTAAFPLKPGRQRARACTHNYAYDIAACFAHTHI